jgi:two-component system chemotaxis response regulator CheY
MKSCLIVDDSKVIRKVARHILETLEFEVEEAGDGQEALSRCEAKMPDVVLLDWNMPVMSGMEFLRLLRQRGHGDQPKVVFCTTENDMAHIRAALEAGADEYVMKPFDRETLHIKRRRRLSRRAVERALARSRDRLPEPRSTGRRIRLMIVDDSTVARAVLSRMVESDPAFEITAVAGTAEDAIEALGECRVDIVVLDLEMPGAGGLKSIPRIISAAAGAKVMIVSSLADDGAEQTVAALALGAADTMPKPGTAASTANSPKSWSES